MAVKPTSMEQEVGSLRGCDRCMGWKL